MQAYPKIKRILAKRKSVNRQGGQVIILNTLFFLAISMIVVFGIAGPVLDTHQITKSFEESKKSFLLANSATEEALYRLKNGLLISSSETITLNNGTAQIGVSNTADGKSVIISSDVSDYQRNIQLEVIQGVGVAFNYGLQTGKGGFEMSGGAGINGNVYANGDILGSGGPYITGSAVSANVSNPVADVSNSGPAIPTHGIEYGGNEVEDDFAQSFQVTSNENISSVKIYVKKLADAWMNNTTVRITTDNGGKPSKTTLATGQISADNVTTNYNYLTIPFTTQPSLNPGTTYWLVFDTSTSWNSHYVLGANSGIYFGNTKEGEWKQNNGGTWSNLSPNNLDIYFEIFMGGDTGIVSGITVGSEGIGDAWANEVNNSTVAGTIYCQAGSDNTGPNGSSKACDTSQPDPAEQPYPISEGNIEAWKDQATAGGTIVGDVSYGGSDIDTIGPVKINGNLNIGSGANISVTGTVYVTGNISISGGAILRLHSDYSDNSEIIVSDGRLSLTGGGQISGSGQAGSYLLYVTTSQCPVAGNCSGNPAVRVTGGTGSVILNAQEGTISFSGGASAKQATAYKIEMDGGTTVNYETGLADMKFNSGPSGGFNLSSWQEIE